VNDPCEARGHGSSAEKCPLDENPEGTGKTGSKESRIRVQVKKPRCSPEAKQRGRNREEADQTLSTITGPQNGVKTNLEKITKNLLAHEVINCT
jgi:hypothetical protein